MTHHSDMGRGSEEQQRPEQRPEPKQQQECGLERYQLVPIIHQAAQQVQDGQEAEAE